MPHSPKSRCSDCRNAGGYASSGSTSSSSTSVSSNNGPLIVCSSMAPSRPGNARKAKVHRKTYDSSSSPSSVSTGASSDAGAHVPVSYAAGQRGPRQGQQNAFAWQLPDPSGLVPRSLSHAQAYPPQQNPHNVHEDRMRYNTAAADAFHGGKGPGLQRSTTNDARIRNRNIHSSANSYMPPRPAIPRSYGTTPYPLLPPTAVPQPFFNYMPDEGELATYRRYNEPDTLDYLRLQEIFKEWERQILLGLIPELNEHKHLWSSFTKKFHSDPPVLDLNAEVYKHTERLQRESAENLRKAARRQKKSVEELVRIDKSRKAYHGNPHIRSPKPTRPVPESGNSK